MKTLDKAFLTLCALLGIFDVALNVVEGGGLLTAAGLPGVVDATWLLAFMGYGFFTIYRLWRNRP